MHLNAGVPHHEARNQLTELEGEESRGATHAHHAARLCPHLGNNLFCGLCFNEHRDATLVELAADPGHREATRGAVEEADAQTLLKPQDRKNGMEGKEGAVREE